MDIFIAIAVALVCAAESRYYLHMLQLESYQLDGYMRYLKRSGSRLLDRTMVIGAGALIAYYALSLIVWLLGGRPFGGAWWVKLLVLIGFAFAAYDLDRRLHGAKQKKPMAYTKRMKRRISS